MNGTSPGHLKGWLCIVCLGLVASCQRQPAADSQPAPDSNVVALVGGAAITTDMLRARLQQRFPPPRTRELSSDEKQSVLDSLIRSESLYARARAAGFDQSPELQAQIKNLVVARFLESQLPTAPVDVTDEAVAARYRANQKRFAQPASAHGAILFIAVPVGASAEKRAETRRHAEGIWNQARHPATETDFATLVARFSDDQASRYRGGDIGWQSAESSNLHPTVRDALLGLDRETEIAPLLETERGFYIVKLLERRVAGQQPLAQVQKIIRREVSRESARQAEREFYDRIRQGLDIRINQELLESVNLPTQRPFPPAQPGMQTAGTQSQIVDPGQTHSGAANARLQ